MNGTHRMLLQSCRTLMAVAALVLLFATVRPAQTLDQTTTYTIDTTTGLIADASKTRL